MDPTVANQASSLSKMPVHKILVRVAAALSDEIAGQLPDLSPNEVKAALEEAAKAVRSRRDSAAPSPAPIDLPPGELDLNRILVVDDIRENLILIQHMFKGTGYHLSLASSAQEALEKARAELPVLVISDIQMPQMSGFELLTALKSNERTQNIAIILVTAHHRTSTQVSQGLQMGADDYIYRPFMPNEFISRVEAVMRLKRAEAETRRQARVVARRNKGLQLVNELALAVNSSTGLQEIFASSGQKLSQLLNADAVAIALLSEDRQELTVHISSRTGRQISRPVTHSRPQTGLSPEKLAAAISDIFNNTYANLGLNRPPDPDPLHLIPMQSKDQTIGAIAVTGNRGQKMDEADLVLLNSAAGIIAVAVENARLLENAQQMVDDLIALNEIGRALSSTLDLGQILKLTTVLVQRLLNAEATSFWLVDESGRELVLTAASGLGSEVITGFRMPVTYGIAGHVAQTGEPYNAADVLQDEHYFDHIAKMSRFEPRSVLSLPVGVKGQVIGVMQALHRNVNWFDHSDLHAVYPIVNSLGIAVENARLFSKVQNFSLHLEKTVAERTRELAAEKEKIEAILASMADGLLVLDADNSILTANAAAEELLNFKLGDMQGRPVAPECLEHPLWRCVYNMAAGDELKATALVDVPASRSGSLLSIQARAAKVRNETGQMIGTVIVLRDITALTEIERVKARFMAGITHELKTPLSVIKLHSGNLLAYHGRLPDEKRLQLVGSIKTQADLLAQLIEDILELSRLDAGLADTTRHPLNLVDLLDQVVHTLRPLAEAKQITLAWHKPSAGVTAPVDRNQMERVARNLIDNAIKYTPPGGKVQVKLAGTTENGRPVALLRISDTGIGIPPEQHNQVFERFHRVDPSHTVPGTGLGLSIVKEIVHAHNGNIQLESIPGKGSTFIVTLPAANISTGENTGE